MTASSKQYGCIDDFVAFYDACDSKQYGCTTDFVAFYDVVIAGIQIWIHKQAMKTRACCEACFEHWCEACVCICMVLRNITI